MVLIPMFFLVSFGFESFPLLVPYSSFESRYLFFFFILSTSAMTNALLAE